MNYLSHNSYTTVFDWLIELVIALSVSPMLSDKLQIFILNISRCEICLFPVHFMNDKSYDYHKEKNQIDDDSLTAVMNQPFVYHSNM